MKIGEIVFIAFILVLLSDLSIRSRNTFNQFARWKDDYDDWFFLYLKDKYPDSEEPPERAFEIAKLFTRRYKVPNETAVKYALKINEEPSFYKRELRMLWDSDIGPYFLWDTSEYDNLTCDVAKILGLDKDLPAYLCKP